MSGPKELHTRLVNPALAGPVQLVTMKFTNGTTADATTQNVFVAPRKVRFLGGKYVQSANATAATSFTATLQVASTAVSQALDIKTLGADTVASVLPSTTYADTVLAEGAQLDVVFNETGGTVTAPADVTLTLEFQLLE